MEKKIIDTARFEGIRKWRYFDSRGIMTIGIGFNLTRPDAKSKIEALGFSFRDITKGTIPLSNDAIYELFREELAAARAGAKRLIPNFYEHPEIVQDILTDLVYNLGEAGFRKFRNTRKAFIAKDYSRAANGLRRSLWYKQVKRRSRIIVTELRKL